MKNKFNLIRLFLTAFIFLLVYLVLNAQTDWVKLNTQWTNCYSSSLHVKGPVIFLGTQNCGVMVSSDSGKTYPKIIPISTIPWGTNTGIIREGNYVVVGVHGNNGIYRSDDNGSTWQKISSMSEPKGADDLIYDGTNLYAAYETGIFKMPIGGTVWTKIKSASSPKALAIKGSKIVASFSPCWMAVSNNGGTDWSADYTFFQYCNIPVKSVAISGNNILAGGNGGLYISSDDCQTWTKVTAGLNNVSEIFDMIEVNNKLYMATDYGAKISTDNGLSWSACGTYQLQPMCFAYESPYLYAGCPSYVYRLKIGSSTAMEELKYNYSFNIMPNPVIGKLKISYQLPFKSSIKIILCDLTGRSITELINGIQLPGQHLLNLEIPRLAYGMYILKMHINENVITEKILIKN